MEVMSVSAETVPVLDPRYALKNERHEKMAWYMASGQKAVDAFELAGYSPDRRNSDRILTNHPEVEARAKYLEWRRMESTVLEVSEGKAPRDWIVGKLVKAVALAERGQPVLFKGEVVETYNPETGLMEPLSKPDLPSMIGASKALGDLEGYFVRRSEHTLKDETNHDNMSEESLIDRILAVSEKLGGQTIERNELERLIRFQEIAVVGSSGPGSSDEDEAGPLQTPPKAIGASCEGGEEEEAPSNGWEPVGENGVGNRRRRIPLDGTLPRVVDGPEIREGDTDVGGWGDGTDSS